jgi:fatty acid desaturase
MPPAARVTPRTFFTDAEWARLTERSDWRGLALVGHAWAVIGLCLAMIWFFPNPLTVALTVMIVGARQLGLAILMHEAAHGQLSPNARLNDAVGEWLCAAPVGARLKTYRPYHLSHHKYAQQAEDPDLVLSAPFPVSRASLWRKIARDLTGLTFAKQRLLPLLALIAGRAGPGGAKAILGGTRPFLLANAILLGGLLLAGRPDVYFLGWLLPMATWFPLVTRLRNIAEHACVPDHDDPLRHARTTHANLIERALIAPYWVNYHCEHHMFMYLPCYRLPVAHKLLAGKGVTARMEVQPGYWGVLARAASA